MSSVNGNTKLELEGLNPQAPLGKTPLDILKDRFARGEIDKDEFEARRRALGE